MSHSDGLPSETTQLGGDSSSVSRKRWVQSMKSSGTENLRLRNHGKAWRLHCCDCCYHTLDFLFWRSFLFFGLTVDQKETPETSKCNVWHFGVFSVLLEPLLSLSVQVHQDGALCGTNGAKVNVLLCPPVYTFFDNLKMWKKEKIFLIIVIAGFLPLEGSHCAFITTNLMIISCCVILGLKLLYVQSLMLINFFVYRRMANLGYLQMELKVFSLKGKLQKKRKVNFHTKSMCKASAGFILLWKPSWLHPDTHWRIGLN